MADLLQYLVASGRLVDIALLALAIEFVALTAFAPKAERARRAVDLVFALGPGACLMLALKAALTGAGWLWVIALVTLSFPLHLIDLARRRQ